MENPTPNGGQTIPQNIAAKRNLIPGAFIMVIIFFFCTFFDLKCVNSDGSMVSLNGKVSITGIQMVTGTQTQVADIPPNMWAIIAFAAALTGAFVFIKKFKKENKYGTIAGTVGFAALLILHFVVSGNISDQGQGKIVADFKFGYWGAILGMALAGAVSYIRLKYVEGNTTALPHNLVGKEKP